MKELSLITHLGLGDLILLSGLAVHFSEFYDRVYVHCRDRDYNSVYSFFMLHERIRVVPLGEESTTPDNARWHITDGALCLGFYSKVPMDPNVSFAENFYGQAGVDYSVRWDKCPIQEVVNRFYHRVGDEPWFDFVHDTPEYRIKGYSELEDRVVRPLYNSASVLAYANSIHRAQEIHVIDSCFLHLTESMEVTGKLHYHKYARPLSARWNDIDCPTRKKWTVLT